MDITCEHCQARFRLPDDRLPKTPMIVMNCPRCRQRIEMPNPCTQTTDGQAADLCAVVDDGPASLADRPFKTLEPGARTALILENDPKRRLSLASELREMGYHTSQPEHPLTAIRQMRFHFFNVLVLNETFGGLCDEENPILQYLNQLPMVVRRNIFVVVLTQQSTQDLLTAFQMSANLTIHLSQYDHIAKILSRGLEDHQAFYQVFNETVFRYGLA